MLRKYKDSLLTFKSATFAAETSNTYYKKTAVLKIYIFLENYVGSEIFSEMWT